MTLEPHSASGSAFCATGVIAQGKDKSADFFGRGLLADVASDRFRPNGLRGSMGTAWS